VSAIDRYVPIHAALQAYERAVNELPRHPLLADHAPSPARRPAARRPLVEPGRGTRLRRTPRVPVEQSLAEARAGLERVAATAGDDGPPIEITWSGERFASGETAVDDPWVTLVREAATAELGAPSPVIGVGYGADMRLYRDRGIPTVLFGPSGIRMARMPSTSTSRSPRSPPSRASSCDARSRSRPAERRTRPKRAGD
jgi:acetylornithine deacetylase